MLPCHQKDQLKPIEMQRVLGILRSNPVEATRYLGALAGNISPAEFFSPENMARIAKPTQPLRELAA